MITLACMREVCMIVIKFTGPFLANLSLSEAKRMESVHMLVNW